MIQIAMFVGIKPVAIVVLFQLFVELEKVRWKTGKPVSHLYLCVTCSKSW